MLQHIKKHIPENYFSWMKIFLKLLGLQPPKDRKKKMLYLLVAIPHFTVALLLGTLQEWIQLIKDFDKDFKVTMFNVTICAFHANITLRMVYWCLFNDQIEKIIEHVQRDTFEFRCFSIYKIEYECVFDKARRSEQTGKPFKYDDLGHFWSSVKVFVNKKINAVDRFRQDKMTQCRMFCCCFYLSNSITAVCILVMLYVNVLGRKYQEFNPKLNTTSTYGIYPFEMYFPFDTSLSHGYYWIGYVYQIYTQYSVSLTFFAIESVSMNTIIHLVHQVIVVGEAFKQVHENIDGTQSKEKIFLIQEIRIVRCINELQDIFRISNMFEDLTKNLMLAEATQLSCMICSMTYTIPLLDITEYVSVAIFFIMILILGQLFIKCFCCQALSIEIEKVEKLIWSLDWPNYRPQMRKNIVFLIQRVQNPATFTAGKFFKVNLAFCVQVILKSYSFYTLIRQTTEQ